MSERDDQVAELYDSADSYADFGNEDRRYDDWRQQMDEEREYETECALTECLQKGVSVESLKVLARETGCVRWALEKSLRSE